VAAPAPLPAGTDRFNTGNEGKTLSRVFYQLSGCVLPTTGILSPVPHRAFFTSMATRALHRGHWTFTGRAGRFRLASRIPM